MAAGPGTGEGRPLPAGQGGAGKPSQELYVVGKPRGGLGEGALSRPLVKVAGVFLPLERG